MENFIFLHPSLRGARATTSGELKRNEKGQRRRPLSLLMKISDKTNTMLHASVVFLFLQPTINYLTLLWRKQLTPLSCGWNIGLSAILCYIYIFRRQRAIILCFVLCSEETFILVSFFKHSCYVVSIRKESGSLSKPSHCSPLHPAGGREALSGAVQRSSGQSTVH